MVVPRRRAWAQLSNFRAGNDRRAAAGTSTPIRNRRASSFFRWFASTAIQAVLRLTAPIGDPARVAAGGAVRRELDTAIAAVVTRFFAFVATGLILCGCANGDLGRVKPAFD